MKQTYKQIKYKNILRLRDVFYPKKRILRFNRPKWIPIKKAFFFKFIKRTGASFLKPKKIFFYKQFAYNAPIRWFYLKSAFRRALLAKSRLFLFFSLQCPVQKLKKSYLNGNNVLINIESRLDVCLWRAGLFVSPAIARFFINHNKVYVNDVVQNLTNFSLREGDLISVELGLKKQIQSRLLAQGLTKTKNNRVFFEKFNLIYAIPPYLEININSLEFIFLKINDTVTVPCYLYNTNLELASLLYYLKRV